MNTEVLEWPSAKLEWEWSLVSGLQFLAAEAADAWLDSESELQIHGGLESCNRQSAWFYRPCRDPTGDLQKEPVKRWPSYLAHEA